MNIGIDLLWVKHKKVGGIESYIRNLLKGFQLYAPNDIEFTLFCAIDNHKTFDEFLTKGNIKKVICNVESNKVASRIIWENKNLNKYAKKHNIDLMFVPVYSKPLMKNRSMKYVITIHDLQALHYPQYFSKVKNMWLKFAWKQCAKTADKIIAISNFVKMDIEKRLGIESGKISVIYNPIVKTEREINFDNIASKYGIESKEYFYTVSSLLPHKNLSVLLKMISKAKKDNINIPAKLVISGIGGKSEGEIKELINELEISENIILTGFVSDEERDALYKNAKAFLFPSIFEGFGMPPIEALMLGTPVVTTKETCIPEVTQNKAIYVDDPFSVDEWIEKVTKATTIESVPIVFDCYTLENVSKAYIDMFVEAFNTKR